jgi:hypothetical protein
MLLLEGAPRASFIESPFVPDTPLLAKIHARFETPDGQPRHPDLILSLLRHDLAMVNAD